MAKATAFGDGLSTSEALAKYRYVTAQEFHESGLLFHVNETILWPLGLSLFVTKGNDGTYVDRIGLMDYGEVIDDGTNPEIRARADAWLAERRATVRP